MRFLFMQFDRPLLTDLMIISSACFYLLSRFYPESFLSIIVSIIHNSTMTAWWCY